MGKKIKKIRCLMIGVTLWGGPVVFYVGGANSYGIKANLYFRCKKIVPSTHPPIYLTPQPQFYNGGFFFLFLFPGGGSVSSNITFDTLVAKGSYSCNNFTNNDFIWYNFFPFFFLRHGYNISICRLLYPNF